MIIDCSRSAPLQQSQHENNRSSKQNVSGGTVSLTWSWYWLLRLIWAVDENWAELHTTVHFQKETCENVKLCKMDWCVYILYSGDTLQKLTAVQRVEHTLLDSENQTIYSFHCHCVFFLNILYMRRQTISTYICLTPQILRSKWKAKRYSYPSLHPSPFCLLRDNIKHLWNNVRIFT